MEIAYTAHTEACTYLLDTEGVCRSVLAASSGPEARGGPVRIPASAERCIGAQYVASLDLRVPGGMVATPTPGAQLLFARTEENGRITLVRTAPMVRFETGIKVMESGVHARPETPSYGDDELTTPFSGPTLPFRREALAPIARASSMPSTQTPSEVKAYAAYVPPPVPAYAPPPVVQAYVPARVPPVPMPARASVVPPTLRNSSMPPSAPVRASSPVPALPRAYAIPRPPSPPRAAPPPLPGRASSMPPPPRASSLPPQAPRGSSLPPAPLRSSGVVPAASHAARATIPPPAPTMRVPRVSYAPPPSYPPPSQYVNEAYLPETMSVPAAVPPPAGGKRPSVVRVSAPFWEAANQPRRSSAR